jgi:hypothetical protein
MRPRILLIDGIGRAQQYTELRAALDAEWLVELTPAIEREAASAIDLAIVSQGEALEDLGRPLSAHRAGRSDAVHDGRDLGVAVRLDEQRARRAESASVQPVLSQKIACVGRSPARLLESWGNLGKCEIVGLPRLDALRGRRPRPRHPGAPTHLLITTAKTPGFSPGQVRRVQQSLQDLKAWIDGARSTGRFDIEPVWRLTFEQGRHLAGGTWLSRRRVRQARAWRHADQPGRAGLDRMPR